MLRLPSWRMGVTATVVALVMPDGSSPSPSGAKLQASDVPRFKVFESIAELRDVVQQYLLGIGPNSECGHPIGSWDGRVFYGASSMGYAFCDQ
eukprot:scaffold2653_cov107-Amphora_coffeaeformis.AAC.1